MHEGPPDNESANSEKPEEQPMSNFTTEAEMLQNVSWDDENVEVGEGESVVTAEENSEAEQEAVILDKDNITPEQNDALWRGESEGEVFDGSKDEVGDEGGFEKEIFNFDAAIEGIQGFRDAYVKLAEQLPGAIDRAYKIDALLVDVFQPGVERLKGFDNLIKYLERTERQAGSFPDNNKKIERAHNIKTAIIAERDSVEREFFLNGVDTTEYVNNSEQDTDETLDQSEQDNESVTNETDESVRTPLTEEESIRNTNERQEDIAGFIAGKAESFKDSAGMSTEDSQKYDSIARKVSNGNFGEALLDLEEGQFTLNKNEQGGIHNSTNLWNDESREIAVTVNEITREKQGKETVSYNDALKILDNVHGEIEERYQDESTEGERNKAKDDENKYIDDMLGGVKSEGPNKIESLDAVINFSEGWLETLHGRHGSEKWSQEEVQEKTENMRVLRDVMYREKQKFLIINQENNTTLEESQEEDNDVNNESIEVNETELDEDSQEVSEESMERSAEQQLTLEEKKDKYRRDQSNAKFDEAFKETAAKRFGKNKEDTKSDGIEFGDFKQVEVGEVENQDVNNENNDVYIEGQKDEQLQVNIDKQSLWNGFSNDVEKFTDLEGLGIDNEIKETVTALIANGFFTTNSCEGHIDKGRPYPSVDVQAEQEPSWRYVNEESFAKTIVEEMGGSLNMLDFSSPEYDWKMLVKVNEIKNKKIVELGNKGELENTEEFEDWQEENNKLQEKIKNILDEYYEYKGDGYDKYNERIVIDSAEGQGFNIRTHSGFDHGVDALKYSQEMSDKNWEMSDEEKSNLEAVLSERQTEMGSFAEFLKDKFMSDEEVVSNDETIDDKVGLEEENQVESDLEKQVETGREKEVWPEGVSSLDGYYNDTFHNNLTDISLQEFKKRFTPELEQQYTTWVQKYVEAIIKEQPPYTRYEDSVAGVLGNIPVVFKSIVTLKEGQDVSYETLLRMPFSEAVEKYLKVKVPVDYFSHFRKSE